MLLLNEIGWGNINSIVKPSTLKKLKKWDNLDKNIYYDIKEKSRSFDSIKFILDIYEPDFLFIFNWNDEKEEDVFRDLKPIWNESEHKEGLISTYNFKEYKTKIIWCPHPNNLKYKSLSFEDLIRKIVKVI